MCDCEVASVHVEEWKRARKPHRCEECSGVIPAGTRYQHIRAVWDHQWGQVRTCIECVQVRDWNMQQLTSWDCAPCYGQLFDDMPREELPPHVIAIRNTHREARNARDWGRSIAP
ncbi:hypothetical protein [Novosphingobium sp. KA1]|uniref:hypothetical protein n=1 Tax=Novosphingobium sp. (strain KA1) TaxID=164608 RepID=UPI001A8D83F6|nr:hypothetical protein [Novosphingobium sp. KA1]QSR18388.1 hypothetical protein CA833_14525 [Novosphingobium sp. KA1]